MPDTTGPSLASCYFVTPLTYLVKNLGKLHWIARPGAAVAFFFASFFLLSASGRMSSSDAADQLRVALLLANAGTLRWTAESGNWILGQDHHYYESHDLGNVLLMLPPAILGSCFFSGSLAEKIDDPPIFIRIGTAFCYAIFSAIGATFLYCLFRLTFSKRAAFFLSLGVVTTTLYWPYSKTAWDVMGACVSMCIFLYWCAMISVSERPRLYAILASVGFGLTCTFRYSLGPFIGIAFASYLIMQRRKLRLADYVLSSFIGFIVLLPTFAYNWIRMGNPLRPGTTAAIFLNGPLAMTGNPLYGAMGLFFAPNRGLFLYSPIFLLLFLLPFYWKRVTLCTRQLILTFLPGAFLYTLLISKMWDWGGGFCWGPRYLLPIVPVLAVAVAPIAVSLWHSRSKPWLVALLIVSAVLTVPPVLVNWHLATAENDDALDHDALYPAQQAVVWRGLLLGVQGKPLPMSEKSKAIAEDSIRSGGARFPDLWLVRLGEQSSTFAVFATLIALVLLVINVVSLTRILAPERDRHFLSACRPERGKELA